MMAFYQDGTAVTQLPNKEKYFLEKSECNNGATIEWDEKTWVPKILNLTQSKTKCNFYFKKISLSVQKCKDTGKQKATDCITLLSNDSPSSFALDGTNDNNLRYIGANPDNYVKFNDEIWRIIGVMNNVDNGSGLKETRLKIVHKDGIGGYAWDNSPSNVNYGSGVNEWSQADLMHILNPGFENESYAYSLYWNRKSGQCYGDIDNIIQCDFTKNGLTDEAKNFFDTAKWYTGTVDTNNDIYQITASAFYNFERSANTGKRCSNVEYSPGTGAYYCNDTVARKTTWIGKVGLMYPSDYGYAVGGESRTSCLTSKMFFWRDQSECKGNDWIDGSTNWTMTPYFGWSDGGVFKSATDVFIIGFGIGAESAYRGWMAVRPVVYLKANVLFQAGSGTIDDPYILQL